MNSKDDDVTYRNLNLRVRRLPEKNIPDCGGFLCILAARKWTHSQAM